MKGVRTKASRVAHRAHATKILNQANDRMDYIDYKDEAQMTRLKGLLSSYKNQFEKIQKLDDEILNDVAEEQVEAEQLKILEEYEIFYEAIARMEACLQKFVPIKIEPATSDARNPDVAHRTIGSPTSPIMSPSRQSVKLPKIVLPSFDGNAMLWQTFWDHFDSSVNSRDELSVIDKFSYLHGLLKNSAKECIEGLALTTANYEEAIKILKERFGNPQVIISAHMESLVKIKPIVNIDNVIGIRKIYDQVESCVRNLTSIGCDPESYGALLIPMLCEKLPSELRMIIARKFNSDIWSLQDMLKYFKEELQAKERCFAVTINKNNSFSRSHQDHTTTSSFYAGQKSYCVYCQATHPSSRCSKVTNVPARRKILRRSGRCFLCLKSGHIAKKCEKDYKCNKCLKHHHISICDHEVGLWKSICSSD